MANSAFTHNPSITVPGSSTDNAVIRWDGTGGKTYLNSGVIIDDSNVITGITSLTVDNLNINGNTIISTDSNGSITLTPNGSGSVVISKVDINSGDITGVTISGGLTWSAAQNLNSQALTNVNIDSGNISAATISGGLTWSANQDLNNVNLTNVDIDSGVIDGATIGANSASTVVATTMRITSGSPSDGKVLTATDSNGNTAWETAGGVTAGLIAYFEDSCPSGWTEYTGGRGRYVVGTPSGGTDQGTVGTALSNVENRSVGQHSHVIARANAGNQANTSIGGSGNNAVNQQSSTNNTGNVAGTNAPYIQLTICEKD